MKQSRIKYLDILRGIAIILIVIGHMERGLVSAGINSNYALILDKILYSFHLPLMFILSGMTEKLFGKLNKNKISYFEYLKKNIIQLYIPYLIFVYLFWFIKMFIFSGNHEATFSDLYTLFYSGKWVFWYLLSLLIIKVVHGIFEKNKNLKYINTIFWILIYILNIILLSKSKTLVLLNWMSYGLFYNVGYNIAQENIHLHKSKYLIFNAIILIIGIFTFNSVPTEINMVLIGIPLAIILIIIMQKQEKMNFIKLCGTYSMVIYLLHTIFTAIVRTVFINIGISNFTLLLLIGTILSILLSLIIVWSYKNIKLFNFVEYFFYPNRLVERKKK